VLAPSFIARPIPERHPRDIGLRCANYRARFRHLEIAYTLRTYAAEAGIRTAPLAGRVFDVKPHLRVLEGGASQDVRQPVDENAAAPAKAG
jgi:hypothetical protein